jgi:hypothetical protein
MAVSLNPGGEAVVVECAGHDCLVTDGRCMLLLPPTQAHASVDYSPPKDRSQTESPEQLRTQQAQHSSWWQGT